jgi:predicted deacylase
VIINAELRDGSLREAVADDDVPVLLYEAGEALRFNEVAIRAGVNGVTKVMRHLGMLPALRKPRSSRPDPLIANSSQWVRAPQSGILRTIVPLGGQVAKGDTIGWVSDPFGQQDVPVSASVAGIVIGRTNLPLVHEGEALFHIARFKEPDSAAESVEVFQEAYDPLQDTAASEEPPIL